MECNVCLEQKKDIFCLFIHVGRFLKEKADMLIMPLGFPMLAGVLDSNGFPSIVFNSGTAKLIGKQKIKDIVERYSPKLIALDLHWHQQIPFVLCEISKIKHNFPKIPVVIGGFTASCFAEKIMDLENSPDYIIRGDGEIPLLELAKNIDNPDKSKIPNLIWKKYNGKNPEIVSNPAIYVADATKISDLNYARYDLVLNPDPAVRGAVDLKRSIADVMNDSKRKTVYYSPGRGCPYNCTFCGGSNEAQMIINGRKGFFFKTHESALKDITGFIRQGFEVVHISFDPEPNQKWYISFFDVLQKNKINIGMIYENWGLPSDEFLNSFAFTFKNNLKNSRIIISPESGSEKSRRINKGFYYTNAQLEHSLDVCKELKINFELFFASCLPGDTAEDFLRTLVFARKIKTLHNCKINMETIIPDPCSPIYLNDKQTGMIMGNNDFDSFLSGKNNISAWETAEKRKKYFYAKLGLN